MTPEDRAPIETEGDEEGALWRLASALASSATPLEVAEGIARDGAMAARALFANLTVLDAGTGRVHILLPVAGFESVTPLSAIDLDEARPVCDALRNGLPVLLGSFDEIERRYPNVVVESREAGLIAGASLPLRSASGTTLGAVAFGWTDIQPFDAAQLRRLDLVAQLTGLALERAGGGGFAPRDDGPALRALETMPNAFLSLDLDLRITYVNPEAVRALRQPREELLGKELLEVFPDVVGSHFVQRYRDAIDSGRSVVFEEYYAPLDGWLEVHAWPDGGALHVYFSDISDRRNVELQRSTELGQSEQANTRLRFLTEISTRLSGARTRVEVFDRLTEAVIPTVADWCTLVVPRGDELVRVAAVHRDPALDGLAKRLVGSYPHAFSGPSPGVVVYRNAEPMRLVRLARQIIADLDDSSASAAYGRTLQLLGDGPGLITPIILRDEVVAVLTMIRIDGELFSDSDVELMLDVASLAASALDQAGDVEIQREMASALQAAALPGSLPNSESLGLGAAYRVASEGSEIGGDWYDAFELPDGKMALVVGDAAGHGLQAAAAMAQMRNELRAYLFASLGPMEALASLNRLIVAQSPDTFATIICFELDLVSGEARWASAGHPAPILVRGDGTSAHLRGEPMTPIGVAEIHAADRRSEHRLTLEPGERVILFTDGLIERRGLDYEIGLAHLMILAEQTRRDGDANHACEVILRDMLTSAHEDDVCILIADYSGQQVRGS